MPSIRRAAMLMLAAGACAVAPFHAQAQAQAPIWRCGDSYGVQPCPGGRTVGEAAAPPTPAERAQAAAAARRDAHLADGLEDDRRRREALAQARGQVATLQPATPAPAPAPHKWPEKAGTRKLDVFTATAPGSGKAARPAAKRTTPTQGTGTAGGAAGGANAKAAPGRMPARPAGA